MNSIIEAQFDFFHDRTISDPEKDSLTSSLHLFGEGYVGLFPSRKQLPDKAPVDKMYVYELPDIVITYADEVYRICKELPEPEAKETINNLYPEDYPIHVKQVNPYSATHHVEYESSKHRHSYLDFMANMNMPDNIEIRWHEESVIQNTQP